MADCPPTPFRYLDKQFVHEKYAAAAAAVDGGHRLDSIPILVPVLDARPQRPPSTNVPALRQQLENQGHTLVDFSPNEWRDVVSQTFLPWSVTLMSSKNIFQHASVFA